MFAEDVGLLPKRSFTELLRRLVELNARRAAEEARGLVRREGNLFTLQA